LPSHRAQALLSRAPEHTEAPALRSAISAVLAVSERLETRRTKLENLATLSHSGLQQAGCPSARPGGGWKS
jgi:hypothetical protein